MFCFWRQAGSRANWRNWAQFRSRWNPHDHCGMQTNVSTQCTDLSRMSVCTSDSIQQTVHETPWETQAPEVPVPFPRIQHTQVQHKRRWHTHEYYKNTNTLQHKRPTHTNTTQDMSRERTEVITVAGQSIAHCSRTMAPLWRDPRSVQWHNSGNMKSHDLCYYLSLFARPSHEICKKKGKTSQRVMNSDQRKWDLDCA